MSGNSVYDNKKSTSRTAQVAGRFRTNNAATQTYQIAIQVVGEDDRALQRALFAAGKIVGATDMDNIQELEREAKVLQIGTITASLYELYKQFVCAPDNDKCSAMAVQGMGFLFPIRPRLFLRAQQDELLKHLLTPPFLRKKTKTFQCLVSMKELLLSEEQRLKTDGFTFDGSIEE